MALTKPPFITAYSHGENGGGGFAAGGTWVIAFYFILFYFKGAILEPSPGLQCVNIRCTAPWGRGERDDDEPYHYGLTRWVTAMRPCSGGVSSAQMCHAQEEIWKFGITKLVFL